MATKNGGNEESESKVSGDKGRDKAKEKMREEKGTRGEKEDGETECQEKEEGERVWLRRKGWTERSGGVGEGGRGRKPWKREEKEGEAVLMAKKEREAGEIEWEEVWEGGKGKEE